MDRRFKNLIILVSLILITLVVFLFLNNGLNNPDVENQVKDVWVKQGVSLENFESVYYLNETGLLSVKNGILKIREDNITASDNQRKLIQVNLLLIDVLEQLIIEDNLNDELSKLDLLEYCSSITLFEERNVVSSKILYLSKEISSLSMNLDSVSWISSNVNVVELENEMNFKNNALSELKEVCK